MEDRYSLVRYAYLVVKDRKGVMYERKFVLIPAWFCFHGLEDAWMHAKFLDYMASNNLSPVEFGYTWEYAFKKDGYGVNLS